MSAHKNQRPDGRLAEGRTEQQGRQKNTAGRPPLEVNGNARRPDQNAPTWEPPAGWAAAELLGDLMRGRK